MAKITPEEAFQLAAKKVGGFTALSNKLGITPQATAQWDKVPANRVLDVERATGVSRYKLRPDVFGSRAPRRPRARA